MKKDIQFIGELKGERIILKKLTPSLELAQEIFNVVDASRNEIGEWLIWVENTNNVIDTMKFLIELEKKESDQKQVSYGIYINNAYTGQIGLVDIDPTNSNVEIGYWMNSKFAGQGIMSEAVKVLEQYVFSELDIHRIQIRAATDNIGSNKVALKNNYLLEGTMREDHFLQTKNSFVDTNVYSKLKKDFIKD